MAAAKKPTAKTAASPARNKPAPAKAAATTAAKKAAASPAKKTSRAAPKATSSSQSTGRTANQVATPQKKANATPHMSTGSKSHEALRETLPKPRFNKDGLGYTKDFDLPFVKEMFDALHAERVRLTGQAKRLEDEAQQLVQEAEMGDVKFDDEGGEGDSTNVERERDLALSAQARDAVDEIDAALLRIAAGTYGYSVESGRPIPRERLEALPWSSVLVEEKVGGIGRR
jgi:RNA polymerase-binding transcription factor DksA